MQALDMVGDQKWPSAAISWMRTIDFLPSLAKDYFRATLRANYAMRDPMDELLGVRYFAVTMTTLGLIAAGCVRAARIIVPA